MIELEPAVHEIIGRPVDEIDDIRTRFHSPNTDLCDKLPDDYLRMIDLATKPGRLTELEEGQLDRSIERLNDYKNITRRLLERTCLLEVYNNVVDQVNEINESRALAAEMIGVGNLVQIYR